MLASDSANFKKANQLLNYLVLSPSFVSLKEIMETFDISRRTAFNWLSLINQTLRRNNMDEIINIPRYGYKVNDETKKKLNENGGLKNFLKNKKRASNSAEERQAQIVLLLIGKSEFLSINELAQKFNCSRNTIIKDFKTINIRFPHLKIVSSRFGHKISSDEISIRITVYELILRQSDLTFEFIDHLNYDITAFRTSILNTQKSLQLNFSENSVQQLTYLLMFTKWRIENNHCIKKSTDANWIKENTKDVLSTSRDLLSTFIGKKVVKGELVFFSKIILCSQATEVNCVNESLYLDLDSIAQEIIFRYEQLTEQQISYNLFTKVLCNHLYATYFRVKFSIPFSSNEVDEIKRQYPELIKFTAIACAPLEHYLKKRLPSEEVALICLYFGSVSNRRYQDLTNSDKLKRASLAEVILVCSSGIGTSAMLYHELSKVYPLIKFSPPLEIRELSEIFKGDYQAKMIISTAILPASKYPIPVVNVKAILTRHDQNIIEKTLREKIPRKTEHNTSAVNSLVSIINEYADVKDESGLRISLDKFIFPNKYNNEQVNQPALINLLPRNHIKFLKNDGRQNWKDVLRTGCSLLEQDGIIDKLYFNKIVHLIDRYGPYMLISNDIFLAHAAPSESSKKPGLAVILMDKPIEIHACRQSAFVTCLFVLSPGTNREHEKALGQLVDIVRDKDNVQRLLSTKSPIEVRKLLLSFY